jgi:hypothetical protein
MALFRWLGRLSRRVPRNASPARPRSRWPRRPLLFLEPLEDRLAPATSITVVPGASGSGSQDAAFLANNGQLLFNAPDAGGNTLSTGALTSIAATNDIVVQATDHITFNDLGGTLTLQTGTGHSATFSTATLGGQAITFNNTANTLATSGGGLALDAATSLTAANLSTGGGDVHLIADSMSLAQVTTGSGTAGVVTLEPFSVNRTIDLGTNSAGNLGLTNTELNQVTAGVLRIGSSSFTGNITVSAAISPANVGALSLITNATGTISQVSTGPPGSPITVAGGSGGLAVQANTSVKLIDQNDVGKLAAAITGAGNYFEFFNSAGFTVSTVDGVVGLSTATGTTETVALMAGGSVNQDGGADITSTNLLLLGTGGYTLTNSGNDVSTLAANVTNAVSYTDANDLTIGSVTDPRANASPLL